MIAEEPIAAQWKAVLDKFEDSKLGLPTPLASDSSVPATTVHTSGTDVTPATQLTIEEAYDYIDNEDVAKQEVMIAFDPDQTLSDVKQYVQNTVAQYLTTISQPDSLFELADALRVSCTGKIRGKTPTHPGVVAIVYDSKMLGESTTHPHIRMPPVPTGHVAKMVGGVLQSREAPGDKVTAIHPGDMFFMLDAMKAGNQAPTTCVVTVYFLKLIVC